MEKPAKAKSNNLEPEGEGDAASAISAVDVVAETRKARRGMRKLEKSIQKLALNDNAKDNSTKEDQISKLEVNRNKLAKDERQVRKAAWIAESRKEVLQLNKFRESRICDLFPELVWKRILTKLEDSEKARLSNLNLVWRAALKMERPVFLFKDVFPLLHVNAYLKRNDILNCRAVCRQWKEGTEAHLQNHFDFQPANLLQNKSVQFHIDTIVEDMDTRFRVEALPVFHYLEWLKFNPPSSGNPFIPARKLRLGCICPHDNQMNSQFWGGAVAAFLSRWGKELRLLAIRLSRIPNFDSAGLYGVVSGYLKLVPNLRQFNIQGQVQLKDTPELKLAMEGKSLPELPQLNILNLHFIPPQLLKSMLNKYRTTLKTVIIHMKKLDGNLILSGIRFPKLKYLFVGSDHFWITEPRLKLSFPAIEELTLQICENAETSLISKLFQSLEQVGGTLKKLNLTFQNEEQPSAFDTAGVKGLSLDLPHLEEFYLTMNMGRANLKTIDYILPMSSLKKLSLCYIKTIPVWAQQRRTGAGGNKRKGRLDAGPFGDFGKAGLPSGEIIRFWNYTKSMKDSNIWLLFPELRKVIFTSVIVAKLPQNVPVFDGAVDADAYKKDIYTREGAVGNELICKKSLAYKLDK